MKALTCWLCYEKAETLFVVRTDTSPICLECKEWVEEYKTNQAWQTATAPQYIGKF